MLTTVDWSTGLGLTQTTSTDLSIYSRFTIQPSIKGNAENYIFLARLNDDVTRLEELEYTSFRIAIVVMDVDKNQLAIQLYYFNT